jgi:hypothetical protein
VVVLKKCESNKVQTLFVAFLKTIFAVFSRQYPAPFLATELRSSIGKINQLPCRALTGSGELGF